MSLAHTLLGLLSYNPMTGYELKQVFDRSIHHFWNAHMSQIYRELNKLEACGWVVSSREEQSGKPDKRIYRLSEGGERELLTWLRQFPQQKQEATRNAFLAHVFFASRLPIEEVLHVFRQYQRELVAAETALHGARKVIEGHRQNAAMQGEIFYWELTLRCGFKHWQAEKEWVEECLVLLAEKAKEG